ncbi:thiamine/thiamine pyrophosphate ABC transporter permease [Marinobacter halophilus]|uniref:Thiamine transport system permease protein ThiP n=1 Tax=Marinobacter halophilus TaxID=1323740 RepID=A0A2T1KH58_9GAMM|nr:thiamine/thiamine pyrophosphate ABC transporter permease [Marinobacter halophilus]PSF09467.1 thiamine/thiamine pyrophosphate ABC transporter, permease protein [Marinobacter halophilus]GGC77522.1 thiamine/thiamine pyrophosphate ABC transporter, permease protein [Marinobacter halophilus]
MINRPSNAPLSHPYWQLVPGIVLGTGLIGLVLLGLGSLLVTAGHLDFSVVWSSRYLRGVVTFTLWQAVLSVLLSLLVAVPVALALARFHDFTGRALLLRLMELSLVLPTIVAVSGIIGVYGRQGWLTTMVSEWFPHHGWNLYGVNGILLAHVFFNAPLAARILLQTLEAVPAPRLRIASQLGLRGWWLWRTVHWPAMRPILPGLAALVFTLCFTSFAIIMTLGGGPATTTLEVAIYQALRFEFDFAQAALLAVIQLVICGSLWWLAFQKQMPTSLMPGRRFSNPITLRYSVSQRCLGAVLLWVFFVFLTLPLFAIILRGAPALVPLNGIPALYFQLLPATGRSLLIAIPAGLGAVLGALLTLAATHKSSGKMLSAIPVTAGYLPLVVPPLVLGTGLFLLLRPGLGNTAQGWALVSFINGLMALPFVIQVLRGPLAELDDNSRRLADQLGVLGWYRWRWLYWPRMRRPIALGLAYGTALSMGDFGVIALFGSPGQPTLPVLMYQQLSSYRVADAAGTGLWLLGLLMLIFVVLSAISRPAIRTQRVTASPSVVEPEHA